MKLSMDWAEPLGGVDGTEIGLNERNWRSLSVTAFATLPPDFVAINGWSYGAPNSTHRASIFCSVAGNGGAFSGIAGASTWRTMRIIRLLSGSKGVTAAPESPPTSMAFRSMRLNPPRVFSPPWQLRHRFFRIAPTFDLNNFVPSSNR